MTAPACPLSEAATDLSARSLVSAALAAAIRDPWACARNPIPPTSVDLLADAWHLLAATHANATRASLGLGESPPVEGDPSPLARWLGLSADVREHASMLVFGLVVSKDCPPYETEFYPSREAASRAQHMADVAGFYNAFGLEPDTRSPERADHASLIIGFVSFLLEKLSLIDSLPVPHATDTEHKSIAGAALAAFVRDHVAWWMPTFGRCLELRAERLATEVELPQIRSALGDLAGVGRLLRAWVAAERISAGIEPARRIVGANPIVPEAEENSCPTVCTGCDEAGDATPNAL